MNNEALGALIEQQRANFVAASQHIAAISDPPLKQANREMLKRAGGLFAQLHQAAEQSGNDARALRNHIAGQTLREDVRQLLLPIVPVLLAVGRRAAARGQAAGNSYATAAIRQTATPSGYTAANAAGQYVDSIAFQNVLQHYAVYHADQAAQILIDGVTNGLNPRRIASMIANYIDTFPAADALRIARTMQLWSMRSAAHETFRANGDVVDRWMWVAQKNSGTCMSCIAMDGTLHDLDETLDDHHNGECAPVPVTTSWTELGFEGDAYSVTAGYETGIDWFNQQSVAVQQGMMGKSAWSAWQAGQFDLAEYPTTYENAVYGTMRRAKSLAELRVA